MPLGDRPPEPLTPAEVRALLAACDGTTLTGMRNRALLVVLWRAGLRIAECLALRECDIDLSAHTIRVRFGKGRKARTVGIDGQALLEIRAWIYARRLAGIDTDLLFVQVHPKVGAQLSARYVQAQMNRLAKTAGVRHRCHPHGLRHTHATELSREGWPMALISRQLGHSNVGTTDRYLSGLDPREVIELARVREWAS